MKSKFLVALAVVALAAGVSHAGPFYVGGSYGNSSIEIDNAGLNFDADDPGFKVYAGYRFLKFLGAEASYVDLGSPTDSAVTIDATGIDAFGVGVLPLGPVELFAKVGMVSWDAEFSGGLDDSGTDLAYGVGVGFGLKFIGFRLEYERFEIENTESVDMVSVGVEWRF